MTAAFQLTAEDLWPAWRLLGWLGHGEVYVALVFLFAVGRQWRRAVDFGVALGLTAWTVGVAKALIAAPRPGWIDPTVHVETVSASTGMPSGHAATAVCLILLVRRPWAVVAVGAFALLVATARVGAGVHSPAQVLAGLGLGVLVVVVTPPLVRGGARLGRPRVMVGALSLLGATWVVVAATAGRPWPDALSWGVDPSHLNAAVAAGLGNGLGLALGLWSAPGLMSAAGWRSPGVWLPPAALGVAGLTLPAAALGPMAATLAASVLIWSLGRVADYGRRKTPK